MRREGKIQRGWPVLRGRLYFFPAFLPLIEIVPWLLTGVGAAAGAAGVLQGRHRNKIIPAALGCFLAAGVAVYAALPEKEVRDDGSRLIPREAMPVALRNPNVQAEEPATPDDFGEIWSQPVQRQILASPVLAGGYMVVGTYDGFVEAYSLKTGAQAWSLPLKNPVFSLGAGKDGIVYAGEGLHHTQSAALTVISAGDGSVLWQREFLGHLEEHPAQDADGETLWLGAGPGGLWSVAAEDGEVLWHRKIGHMDSTPLLIDGVLYAQAQVENVRVGTKRFEDKSFLYAMDAADGEIEWQTPLPGQPWGEPVARADGKALLTTSGQGQIGVKRETDRGWAHAVSLETGKILWQSDLPGMAVQPAIYEPGADLFILTVKTGAVVALEGATGKVRWSVKVGEEFQSAATPVETSHGLLVAAATFDGSLGILRAADGAVVARRPVPRGTTSSPLAAGDALFVTSPYRITAFGGIASLGKGK